MPTWPAYLPQSLSLNTSQERDSGMIRSKMDAGPAKQRRRFTAVAKRYSGEMVIDGNQFSAFEAFYEDDLAMGALAFDWADPVDDSAASVRFPEEYKATCIVGNGDAGQRLWRVSMAIEVLP